MLLALGTDMAVIYVVPVFCRVVVPVLTSTVVATLTDRAAVGLATVV